MAKFVSRKAPVSSRALKRRGVGTAVVRHYGRVDVRFTRVVGGWCCERVDVTSENPTVVTSADVARECNSAVGCKESWARIF